MRCAVCRHCEAEKYQGADAAELRDLDALALILCANKTGKGDQEERYHAKGSVATFITSSGGEKPDQDD